MIFDKISSPKNLFIFLTDESVSLACSMSISESLAMSSVARLIFEKYRIIIPIKNKIRKAMVIR